MVVSISFVRPINDRTDPTPAFFSGNHVLMEGILDSDGDAQLEESINKIMRSIDEFHKKGKISILFNFYCFKFSQYFIPFYFDITIMIFLF